MLGSMSLIQTSQTYNKRYKETNNSHFFLSQSLYKVIFVAKNGTAINREPLCLEVTNATLSPTLRRLKAMPTNLELLLLDTHLGENTTTSVQECQYQHVKHFLYQLLHQTFSPLTLLLFRDCRINIHTGPIRYGLFVKSIPWQTHQAVQISSF